MKFKKDRKTKPKISMKGIIGSFITFVMIGYLSTFYIIVNKSNIEDETIKKEIKERKFDSIKERVVDLQKKPIQDTLKETTSRESEAKFEKRLNEPLKEEPEVIPQEKLEVQTKVEDKPQMERPKLKAFIEKIDQEEWKIKPLPARKTKASELDVMEFDVSSCKKLPEQWPVNENVAPTNKDPFLPWIHDVFPTADGKFIQFVAQNKRRCQSGRRKTDVKKFMEPNIALFQHVPIQRINVEGDKKTQYRLTSHEQADEDGVETRFICRFKPSGEETLSVFNFNYDFHTLRKAYSGTFTEAGFDNHMIWSSQFLFRCPVPPSLQEDIKSGRTVMNDYASLFVDLIPIRTPPRFGKPTRYLPPRLFDEKNDWDVEKEWGQSHILPAIEDSGRWENIPICKPSLMTFPDEAEMQSDESDDSAIKEHDEKMLAIAESGKKKHEIIACTWTSAAFKTRGGRTSVNDGQQRLRQWLEFNRIVGVDHVYIYDNSGSFSSETDLKPVTDLFPGYVTRVNWPAQVCNNNRGNADNKGERSSQYAADASCRLRFGAHSTWLASYDTDEYIVPMEKYADLKELMRKVEKEDIRVLNFQSKRSKPRLQHLNTTFPGDDTCPLSDCFDPALPEGKTFLEVYNCNNEKPPRKVLNPAEKAIYKPDYVLQFFVHYATVTALSATGKKEAKGGKWFTRYNTKQHSRFVDEATEGTMLHTKAIVAKETRSYKDLLSRYYSSANSIVGVDFPSDIDIEKYSNDNHYREKNKKKIDGGFCYPNCYPVDWIEKHWSPKLKAALEKRRNI